MGTVNGRTYAFAGLERIGGVMICDITDPSSCLLYTSDAADEL